MSAILKGHLGDLYENDSWMRGFMDECLLLWGLPCSSLACMSQKDRTFFAWGMLHLTHALRKNSAIWKGMKDKIEPDAAAWEFARRFSELSDGEPLIPTLPETSQGQLALSGGMKTDGSDAPPKSYTSGSL